MRTSRNAWMYTAWGLSILLCTGCTTPPMKPQLGVQAQAEAFSHFSLGLLAESNGKPADALRHFKETIRIDPGEPSVFASAISAALQLDRKEEALELGRQLVKQQPNQLPARLMAAQVQILTGHPEEAEILLRDTLADFPDQAENRLVYARFLISEDRTPEAIALLEPVRDQHGGHAGFIHLLGTLYIGRARTLPSEAEARPTILEGIDLIQQALGLSPDQPQWWHQLGYAWLAISETQQARDAFEEAYKLFPSDIQIARPLLDLCTQNGELDRALALCIEIPRSTRTTPEMWFRYINERIPPNQHEKLISTLESYIEEHPVAPAFYYTRLGSFYLDLDRIPDAERILLQAKNRFPDNNRLQTAIGYLYVKQQQYKEAYDLFRHIQATTPDAEWTSTPFFTFNLMVAAQNSGCLKEAAETLAASYTNNPAILNHTMHELLTDEEPVISSKSTIELLHAFRALTPEARETLYYLSILQAVEEDYEPALEHARQFETLARGSDTNFLSGAFYYQYAVLHERIGQLPEAEAQFRKAIDLGNQATADSARNYIAYMWAERGEKLEMGLQLIQQALEAEPDNAAFIDTLGWIYYMQGRYAEALDALKKASTLLDSDPVIWEHLGDIYLKLGDTRTAVEHWEKALEISPEEDQLIERLNEHRLSPDGRPAPADSPAGTQPRP